MKTLSKITLGLLLVAANTAYSASVRQNTSVTYWGADGDHADLVIYNDFTAPVPVDVTKALINSFNASGIQESMIDCRLCTPLTNGNTVIGQRVQPGGFVVIRAYKTTSGIVGEATLSDNTANQSNINQYIRGSLEIRDIYDNVLTHVEMR